MARGRRADLPADANALYMMRNQGRIADEDFIRQLRTLEPANPDVLAWDKAHPPVVKVGRPTSALVEAGARPSTRQRGFVITDAQFAWLKEKGWVLRVGASGVVRQLIDAAMRSEAATKEPEVAPAARGKR